MPYDQGAWVPVHVGLLHHPKTEHLAALLADPTGHLASSDAFYYLVRLWIWAMQYAPDGHLAKYSSAQVAKAADFPGDADTFHTALQAAHWLDADGRLHEWELYGGKLFAKRAADAARQAKHRALSHGHHVDVTVTSTDVHGGHTQEKKGEEKTVGGGKVLSSLGTSSGEGEEESPAHTYTHAPTSAPAKGKPTPFVAALKSEHPLNGPLLLHPPQAHQQPAAGTESVLDASDVLFVTPKQIAAHAAHKAAQTQKGVAS